MAMTTRTRYAVRAMAAAAGALLGDPADAQSAPTIDTEDATMGSVPVGDGRFHPVFGVDLRNGDFARGSYDDDAATLARLPAHVQLGLDIDLHRDADGEADGWLVLNSSNGLHAPTAAERVAPRAWYESNNLVGVVVTPAAGLRTAVAYAIKTSPNGVSATTQEASLSVAYETERGLGALHPSFVATVRPKGGHGLYIQAGIEPELALEPGDDAAKLGFPAAIGIGWGGFYEPGSGDRLFGNAGVALSKPFRVGTTRWTAHATMLALIRDDRLRRLSGPLGETGTVVPLATIGLSFAY